MGIREKNPEKPATSGRIRVLVVDDSLDFLAVARAWIAGLAAYQKKVEYGSATIRASDVVFEDNSPQSLVQTGSRITINDAGARTSNLDVNELYARLEALATMRRVDYRLGPAIRLVGHTPASTEFHPGDELRFYLYWQAESQPERNKPHA